MGEVFTPVFLFYIKLNTFSRKLSNALHIKHTVQRKRIIMTISKFQNFLKRSGLDEKPFQLECFQWCFDRETQAPFPVEGKHSPKWGPRGLAPAGVLALEMGLGKTIIMLGLIECNFKKNTLIILPLALLDQWEKCLIKFFGHQPLVYHGSRPKNLTLSLAQIKTKPIILTTYGQISQPSEKQARRGRLPSLLHEIQWDRLICDEAHHISHKKTNEYKGVLALKAQIKWLVTGTPIQNNEQELHNLFTILGFENDKVYYNQGTNYADAINYFVYHKTKADAGINLPPLKEHTEIVQWANTGEREFSSHIHSLLECLNVPLKAPALEILDAITDAKTALGLRFKYMSKAKKVCIYPPMLLKNEKYENTIAESKINAIIKTLTSRHNNGNGKIVFCHYYAEIDALANRLQEEGFTNIRKFDGRIKTRKEQQAILTDPNNEVLLAQIKMCREGLNLQDNYSEVYFPSPDFNPTIEDQAIARCWRIGQTKEVNVFRYIMEPTDYAEVEEKTAEEEPTAGVQEPVEIYSMDTYSASTQEYKREIIERMYRYTC
jgi:SNF2 family DNA or RNA helicase